MSTSGSGGQRKQGLEGKGPTPKAKDRAHHPAARRARKHAPSSTRTSQIHSGDVVIGRNPVLEALRAGVPATGLYLQVRAEPDDRWRDSLALAQDLGIPVFEGARADLDDLSHHGSHQGLVLAIKDYEYADLDTVATGNLVVLLDGITDTHNVGAIARSAAAFGASGLILPSRRSAGITASAWKASAGALSRLPVARVTNLRSTLETLHSDGWMSIGLDARAQTSISDIDDDDHQRPPWKSRLVLRDVPTDHSITFPLSRSLNRAPGVRLTPQFRVSIVDTHHGTPRGYLFPSDDQQRHGAPLDSCAYAPVAQW